MYNYLKGAIEPNKNVGVKRKKDEKFKELDALCEIMVIPKFMTKNDKSLFAHFFLY